MPKEKKSITVRFRITPSQERLLLRLIKASYQIPPSLSEFSREAVEEKMKTLSGMGKCQRELRKRAKKGDDAIGLVACHPDAVGGYRKAKV